MQQNHCTKTNLEKSVILEETRLKRSTNSWFNRLLTASMIGASALTGTVVHDAIRPSEAEACASYYNPQNSFYERHVKPLARNPEILKDHGNVAYVLLWAKDGINHLLGDLTNPEALNPIWSQGLFPELDSQRVLKYDEYTQKLMLDPKRSERVTLYRDLASVRRVLSTYEGDYIIEVRVDDEVKESLSFGNYRLVMVPTKRTVIVSEIYDRNGNPLKLLSEKPLLSIPSPSNPQQECRVKYSLAK